MKKAVLFLAEGFEEIEAIAVIDVLRRGGIGVSTVSISTEREVTGAHGVPVMADFLFSEREISAADCLIFPGGMPGAANLAACEPLIHLLQLHFDRGGCVAAICAAPAFVLSKLHTNTPLELTCYPGLEKHLLQCRVSPEGVVVDGQVITAKGPAFAVEFGLTILNLLTSTKEISVQVARGMLY